MLKNEGSHAYVPRRHPKKCTLTSGHVTEYIKYKIARISLTVRDRAKRTKIWDHQLNSRCTWQKYFLFFLPKSTETQNGPYLLNHKRQSETDENLGSPCQFPVYLTEINFCFFDPKSPKHKIDRISLTVRDRAKLMKIWDHQVNLRILGKNNFFLPKIGETQNGPYLLNPKRQSKTDENLG